MTCGKWLQPGHEEHICTECTDLIEQKTCGDCQTGCTFRKASPECLKLRNEVFGRSKEEKALERVLTVLKEEKLTIRESHIVLGMATRQLLEINIKVHGGVRA